VAASCIKAINLLDDNLFLEKEDKNLVSAHFLSIGLINKRFRKKS
jgi:hypothetical protein